MSEVVSGTLLAEVFVTLFVIMDPPGTIPLFLALTSKETPRQRKRQAWQAVAVAFLVIVSFALFGRQLPSSRSARRCSPDRARSSPPWGSSSGSTTGRPSRPWRSG
jgi:hypothetical protein